jgi:RNA polymerase sigma-70 factor (ECF subfamily)
MDVRSQRAPDPDQPLLRRARAGDFEAFEELVRRHERRLYGLSMGILRQREDAENVVQTTFLKMLEHLDGFREESSFSTWITRIATYGALNVLRKRKGLPTVPLEGSQSPSEEGDIQHPDYIADWRGDPAEIVERKELREILTGAIDKLPENHRLVFVLRDIEGLSVAETAEVLAISEANVKVRLLRARLALREALTRIFGDEAKTVVAAHDHLAEGGGAERGSDGHGGDGSEVRSTPAEAILKEYDPS